MKEYKVGEEIVVDAVVRKFLFTDFKTGESKYQISPTAKFLSDIYTNKLGLTNITGSLPKLVINAKYKFTLVTNLDEKYGFFYNVKNVDVLMPDGKQAIVNFLSEITSRDRAETIVTEYPDFIEKMINDEEIDVKKLYGVGPKTIEKLSRKIKDRFKEIELYKALDGIFPYRFICAMVDKGYSISKIKGKLKTEPYRFLCSLRRVGFKTADELVNSITLEYPNNNVLPKDVLISRDRYAFAVEYFIMTYMSNTGNTYAPFIELKKEIMRSIINVQEKELDEILDDKRMFVVSKNKKYISIKKYYDMEVSMYNTIKEALNIKPWKRKIDLSKYEILGKFKMSKEQLEVIPMVLNNRISVLNGYAGTGKTDCLRNVIRCLDDLNMTYKLMTPTGKASKVLSSRTGKEATTIHVGLECTIVDKETNETYFNKNSKNKLFTDVIIIDEASMIDTYLMYHLLEAINFEYTSLLLVGDDAQLPSVGPGNIFSVLKNESKIPNIKLTEVFRYGDGGIDTAATNTRLGTMNLNLKHGDTISYGNKADGLYEFKDLYNEEIVNEGIKKYVEEYNKTKNFDDVLLLTYKRKNTDYCSTEAINPIIQDIINPHGHKIKVRGTALKFRIGDYVMQTKNDYNATKLSDKDVEEFMTTGSIEGSFNDESEATMFTNGATGIIVDSYDDGLIIESNGEYIYVPSNKIQDIELAYCITIHKSQGSQAKTAIILSPSNHVYGMSSNLLYVAISRTKEQCFHFGNSSTINRACKIHEENNRKTTFENLFKGLIIL